MRLKILGALALMLSVAGCDLGTTEPWQRELIWSTSFDGREGWEELMGQGAFSWIEGANAIRVAVVLFGDEPGTVRAWRLRQGTCATGGDLLGSSQAYPNLVTDVEGFAEEDVQVGVGIDPSRNFHLEILTFGSIGEEVEVVACGNMEFVGSFLV